MTDLLCLIRPSGFHVSRALLDSALSQLTSPKSIPSLCFVTQKSFRSSLVFLVRCLCLVCFWADSIMLLLSLGCVTFLRTYCYSYGCLSHLVLTCLAKIILILGLCQCLNKILRFVRSLSAIMTCEDCARMFFCPTVKRWVGLLNLPCRTRSGKYCQHYSHGQHKYIYLHNVI